MRLFIVRHGETEWNQLDRLQGQTDTVLSCEGRKQVHALAPWLVHLANRAVVFASDLQRTCETADLLELGKYDRDQRFRELDAGCWSGAYAKDLQHEEGEAFQLWQDGAHTPLGGESWERFRARVEDGLASIIKSSHENAVLVTHGGVVRAIMDISLGVPPALLRHPAPATVTVLKYPAGGARLAVLEGYSLSPAQIWLDSPS